MEGLTLWVPLHHRSLLHLHMLGKHSSRYRWLLRDVPWWGVLLHGWRLLAWQHGCWDTWKLWGYKVWSCKVWLCHVWMLVRQHSRRNSCLRWGVTSLWCELLLKLRMVLGQHSRWNRPWVPWSVLCRMSEALSKGLCSTPRTRPSAT